jgi:hypothetical protein
MNDAFTAAVVASCMFGRVEQGLDASNHPKEGIMYEKNRSLRLAAFGLALIAGTPAFAGDDDRAATADELARVRAALEARGYSDVHDLEVDDGRFEVDARNPEGQSVDLELDLETLEILYEDRD